MDFKPNFKGEILLLFVVFIIEGKNRKVFKNGFRNNACENARIKTIMIAANGYSLGKWNTA